MKLYIILLFILGNAFCACNRFSEKNETAGEIQSFEKEIDSLKNELIENQKIIDSLTNKGSSNFEHVDILTKDASVKVFDLIISCFRLDEYPLYHAVFGNSLFSHWLNDNDFNRSPEFISEYFGNAEIEFIANLIEESDFSFYVQIKTMVKCLVITHDELYENRQRLLKALSSMSNDDVYYDLLSSPGSEMAYSVIQTLDKENPNDAFFKFNSFWVRRYLEGNSEAVYSILTKLNSGISEMERTKIFYFDRDSVISQILSKDYCTDNFNQTTFNFLVDELKAYIVPFEDYIAYHPIFIRRELKPGEQCFTSVHYVDRGIDTPDYMCKLNKMYSDFERTPENISKVFNETVLDHIALLFNKNILSKDYKTFGVLEGLLMTYEELGDNDCDRLYQLLELKDLNYYENVDKCEEAFKNQVSDRVLNYVKTATYCQYYDNSNAGYDKRLFYLYSFWARRYHEGNKEAVYKILNRLDQKIFN